MDCRSALVDLMAPADVLRAMTRIEAAMVEKTVPSHSRDIARILASLQDVGRRLQSLEAQPMLRNTPEQIQQRQAYAVKDAVATREQLDRAAYTVRETSRGFPPA